MPWHVDLKHSYFTRVYTFSCNDLENVAKTIRVDGADVKGPGSEILITRLLSFPMIYKLTLPSLWCLTFHKSSNAEKGVS
ncbi:hypothetical protein NQ317_009371, partial [Molorchus minor]